jgi:hypothetical protein
MKSDDIKRSVRAQRHDRAAGDAPSMGKLTRMPGTGLPKGERRKRRKSDGHRNRRILQSRKVSLRIWSGLLAFCALACLGVLIWLGLRTAADREVAPAVALAEEAAPAPVKFPVPTEDQAQGLVKHALAIREPAEVTRYFRLGKTSPTAVVDFLKSLDTGEGPLSHYEWLGSMDANGLPLEGVLVHFKGTDKLRNRLALLTPDQEGVWKIDFDAFARSCEPAWDAFLGKRADSIVARVYIARDSYYNGLFSDESEWVCYGIASPDTEEVLLGYCKVGSPQAAALKWILSKDLPLSRAVLEIRQAEGGLPRQYVIGRLLAEDWVMGDTPFEQGFE